MSQRIQQGQPMIIVGEDIQYVKDRDTWEYNICAARVAAEAVRSTLNPKGVDKMLVDSMGDVTIANDGVAILREMDVDNPTTEMIVEVAETQKDEADDGMATAIAIVGELLKNAGSLLEQDIYPTAIIRDFNFASGKAREGIDDIAERIDPDNKELLRKVAETSVVGKSSELSKESLTDLIVCAVRQVTVETSDGSHVVDLENVSIETRTGRSAPESEFLTGAVVDKDPIHDDMPVQFDKVDVLLLGEPVEVEETDVDTSVSIESPDQLQKFLDQKKTQLEQKIDQIVDSGADVVFCQRGIDDLVQHYLAKQGILAVRRTKKSNIRFLKNIAGAAVVSNLDSIKAAVLGRASVRHDEAGEPFYVEGIGDNVRNITLLLRGSADHMVNELERDVQDAFDVVASTVADGRALAGGGAIEVELASRLRNYAGSVSGREQLAVEAYADTPKLVLRVLAEDAGLDSIDALIDLCATHEDGQVRTGLNIFADEVKDTFDTGVVETAHAKGQAVASTSEAVSLVLKIDGIIAAGDLSTGSDDDGEGGTPGGMGGVGGMDGIGGTIRKPANAFTPPSPDAYTARQTTLF